MQVSATETVSEKVADMVATFLNEDNTGIVFKRKIGYTRQQVVSENGKVATKKTSLQKVDTTVYTFFDEYWIGSMFERGIGNIYQHVIRGLWAYWPLKQHQKR